MDWLGAMIISAYALLRLLYDGPTLAKVEVSIYFLVSHLVKKLRCIGFFIRTLRELMHIFLCFCLIWGTLSLL